MISITITAKDLDDLKRKVDLFVGDQSPVQMELPVQEPVVKKKAKKKAAKKVDKIEEKVVPVIDKSEVSAALQKLAGSQGMEALKELLSKFEAVRVSDLKPGQYAAVLEACK